MNCLKRIHFVRQCRPLITAVVLAHANQLPLQKLQLVMEYASSGVTNTLNLTRENARILAFPF